jgi:hypothetical protein
VRLRVVSDGLGEPRVTDEDGRVVEDVVNVRWRQEAGSPATAQIEVCPAPAEIAAEGRIKETDPRAGTPALEPDPAHRLGLDAAEEGENG